MPYLSLVIIGWPVCTEIELSLFVEIVVGELTDEGIKGSYEETIWSGKGIKGSYEETIWSGEGIKGSYEETIWSGEAVAVEEERDGSICCKLKFESML